MYYRTTYRLGDGIVRIMRWVMRAEIPAVRLSHLLVIVWLYFLLVYQAPKVFALVSEVFAMDGRTSKVAPVRKCECRKHVSFITEAVAQKYGHQSSTGT